MLEISLRHNSKSCLLNSLESLPEFNSYLILKEREASRNNKDTMVRFVEFEAASNNSPSNGNCRDSRRASFIDWGFPIEKVVDLSKKEVSISAREEEVIHSLKFL